MYLNQIQSYLITSTPIHIPLLSLSLSLFLSFSLSLYLSVTCYVHHAIHGHLGDFLPLRQRCLRALGAWDCTVSSHGWLVGRSGAQNQISRACGARVHHQQHVRPAEETAGCSCHVGIHEISIKLLAFLWGSTSFLGENLGVSINVSAVNLMWSHVLVNGGAPAF